MHLMKAIYSLATQITTRWPILSPWHQFVSATKTRKRKYSYGVEKVFATKISNGRRSKKPHFLSSSLGMQFISAYCCSFYISIIVYFVWSGMLYCNFLSWLKENCVSSQKILCIEYLLRSPACM